MRKPLTFKQCYHIGLWLFDRCIALSLYLVVAVLTVCNFLDLE